MRPRRDIARPANPLALITALTMSLALAACDGSAANQNAPDERLRIAGADAARGKVALRAFGCGACHIIEGVPEANGLVGPPLNTMNQQSYVAGVVPNTPDRLIQWIMDPKSINPRTAMPDLNVTKTQAADMAAYLYEKRGLLE